MVKDTRQDSTFATLVQSARDKPPRMSQETEIPSLFSPPSDDSSKDSFVAKELTNNKPGRQIRLVSFTRTFVLWRPWEKCSRCLEMLKQGEIELPSIGDMTCPHVQLAEYKEIKDAVLRGDGIKEFEEYFQLHDGTRCVQFSWLEADPEFLEKMKKEAQKNKDSVYPPNPEKVFNQKEEETPNNDSEVSS